MAFEEGIEMIMVLLQELSAMFLVYGAYLVLVFVFGKDTPRLEGGGTRAKSFRAGEAASASLTPA